jgi:hypothetical protein
MKTFNSYEYFKTIIDKCGINSIRRCSGIMNLEEVLSGLGTIKPPVLVVEDNDNGFLSLSEGNFDSGYNNVYILKPAKLGQADEILKAREDCKDLMKALFLRMSEDKEKLWLDYGGGLDNSRIDYAKIGPVASGFYGYSAGFQMNIDFSFDNNEE